MCAIRLIAAPAVLAVAVAGCSLHGETRDAGPVADRNFAVGAFQKIEVAGPYDVTVASAGSPGVKAHGGRAILDELDIRVDDGVLKIGPKDHHWRMSWIGDRKVTIAVTGANSLTGASLAGSGDVGIDSATGDNFKGEVAGSGGLTIAQLKTGAADLSIAGSGSIKAAGTAARLHAEIAGSGDIDAGQLAATDAKLEVAGSGNVRAHATGTADVEILGSGDVTVTGGAKCSVSKHGSGNVTCS